jgi:sugar O-acyltransferase (sialic acid O-acetyltransferase NeuD family)
MSKKLIIFPFGGNAREAAATIAGNGSLREKWELIGFIDDDPAVHGKEAGGVSVLGGRGILKHFPEARILAVPGNPRNYLERQPMIDGLNLEKEQFAQLISPAAVIMPDADVGYNTLVLSNSVIGSGTSIGKHCIILPNTTIGHDSLIGDYCCIGANVAVSGHVTIQPNCYIGSGTTIRDNVIVHEKTLVGIGSNVISDIDKNVIVAGNPARLIHA